MISIICVYNNKKILDEVLLESLKSQTLNPELILLNNISGRFKSAAEALNYGGQQATGDILIFIHQDMWIHDPDWLENVERYAKLLPDLGVAGVAGMYHIGDEWSDRVKYSIKIINAPSFNTVPPVSKPELVQTLDECVLIVPRQVFELQQFDDITFDGWDCYAADFCLTIAKKGYRSYVFPGLTSHCCLRANYEIYEFKGLLKYQKRLYQKHQSDYVSIHTWMGCIDMHYIQWCQRLGIFKPLYNFFFPEFRQVLVKLLSPCKSVLDLGCGYLSPLLYYKHHFAVGVDSDHHLLLEGKKLLIHDYYIQAELPHVEFKSSTFDAVIVIDVIDLLSKKEGELLLQKMEKWYKKKIIVKTVNKGARLFDGTLVNPPWTIRDFRRRGYKVRGLGGVKYIRSRETRSDYNFLRERLINITYWFCYFFPILARDILAVKNQ